MFGSHNFHVSDTPVLTFSHLNCDIYFIRFTDLVCDALKSHEQRSFLYAIIQIEYTRVSTKLKNTKTVSLKKKKDSVT